MADNKKETTASEKETKGAVEKVAAAVKTEAKKADTVIDEVAESVKKEAKKVEEKVEAKAEEVKKVAKETVAKVTTPKKKATTTKATAKKTEEKAEKAAEKEAPAKTASTKSKIAKVYIQYDGGEASQEELIKRIIDKWIAESGKKETAIKSFEIYIKPEDNAAYYVINGQGSSIKLF